MAEESSLDLLCVRAKPPSLGAAFEFSVTLWLEMWPKIPPQSQRGHKGCAE
jgi:hypothetical protein